MNEPKCESTGVAPGALIPFPVKSSDGVLDHLSPSGIKDYLGCSLRFYFKRVLKLPEPASQALHLGKSVHAAIQAFWLAKWRGGDTDTETISKAFLVAFNALLEADGVQYTEGERKKSIVKGDAVVRAYLDSDHAKSDERPVGVEVRLEEHLGSIPSPLLGYIDLVRPGNVVVDFKTCASTPNVELEGFLHELQLIAYQLLVEASTGEPVTARELVFLVKTKTPKVIVHRMKPADSHAIERFWSMAEAATDAIYHERWTPQPGMHCSWCPYRRECAQWKGGLV